jgi:hypothetical protein
MEEGRRRREAGGGRMSEIHLDKKRRQEAGGLKEVEPMQAGGGKMQESGVRLE